MIDELVTWGGRLFRLLPEIMGLWEATRAKNAKQQLDAQLALVRAIEDQQMLEELSG